ncbi:molybdopterin-dependent oxidoreductase [Bacillus sp. FJAT-27251]|uniref:molybdopterin-dependent oxidoreductase n=1 Tax=Bacillus sp. FJAT-27251 TaxID=1684142 RepID=UPI0006A7A9E2|nr:molybdopterin-dependent oxidoreductase [Bacillus sp. FJAT-27251]
MEHGNSITRHVCPRNCYSTCSMLGFTKNGILEKVTGDPQHQYTKGLLCAKGYNYINQTYHPERLKYPMIQRPRGSGNWQQISWSEALGMIADKIIELHERYGTHESLALNKYSGNMGVLHKAMEGFFNGLGRTSRAEGNPCWSAGMDAVYYDFGGHQTSDMEDILYAKTIILWGVNPVWTSIHSMNYIYEAQRQGAKVITIDPIYTETAKKSDAFIQVKPNGDGALAAAIAKHLLDHHQYDADFLSQYTTGWEELRDHLNSLSMEEALRQSGQTIEAIEFLAECLSREKPAFIWIGFGMQRHQNGGQNIRAINALAAMTGNIGFKGSGVQFAQRSTWKFSDHILHQANPQEKTSIRPLDMNDFAKDLQQQEEPPIRFLWIACRNLLSQSSNIEELKKALQPVEMIVTVEHFLTETAQFSDLVLPATMLFEEWEIMPSYWHHWISINEPAIEPYYECKSDLEIARLLSRRLNDYKEGFSAFPATMTDEQFIEQEFTDELYQLLGITHWRELLDGPRKADVSRTAWERKEFKTPSGKIELYSLQASERKLSPVGMTAGKEEKNPQYPYRVLLNHEPFRINSQFRNLDSFKKIMKDPSLYLHPSLAKEKGIEQDSLVKLFNEKGEIIMRANLSHDVNPETLIIYPNHPRINRLISFKEADMGMALSGGKGNALNDVQVDIKKLN